MSMERSTTQSSAYAVSTAGTAETHELILVIECMHLGRGKGDSTLKKVSQGDANRARKIYIVVHLPLKTEGGDSAMRAEVAREVHLLIKHYNPNTVIIATDYNIGTSGGECTLPEFSEFLMNPPADLNLPPILIDNQTLRTERDAIQQAHIQAQNKAKHLVIVNYVLFGGNVSQLNAACEEFGLGKHSHWMLWRANMNKIMRPSTPDARHRSLRERTTQSMAQSTPNIGSIDELGTTRLSYDAQDIDGPAIGSRTMSLPTNTSSASPGYDGQMQSPSFSDSGTPLSFEGNSSPESSAPYASPDETLDLGTTYQLSHIPSDGDAGTALSPDTMLMMAREPNVILPQAAAPLTRRSNLAIDDYHRYNELIGDGHLDIPKTIMFNTPLKLREFTRRNSLDGIEHPRLHNAPLAAPQAIPVTTSPATGANGVSTSRFTTSQTSKGSPAGIFARRISATKALRVDVTAPDLEAADRRPARNKN